MRRYEWGMRIARYLIKRRDEDQIFHVMSRVVGKEMVFDDDEKALFYRIMRQMEGFTGCEVLTFCLMDNHFHLLLKVPSRKSEISDDEVLRRIGWMYPSAKVKAIAGEVLSLRQSGDHEKIKTILDPYRKRMYDLSEYVKGLKQRFTMAYNRQHERKGTLWEERFKSVLIDPKHISLLTVAGYIDRNPVRAGICERAEDYEWSGIGRASKGEKESQYGISVLMKVYRPRASSAERIAEYLGVVNLAENQVQDSPLDSLQTVFRLIKTKCKQISNGIVLGGKEFLEKNRVKNDMDSGELRDMNPPKVTGTEFMYALRKPK